MTLGRRRTIPGLIGYGRRGVCGVRSPFRGRHGLRVRPSNVPPMWIWILLAVLLVWGAYPWISAWREKSAYMPPHITIWRTDVQELVDLPLDTYVKGVVAAEMPASFHPEALAAQAVAARTYAVRAIQNGRRVPGRPEAVFTDKPGSGQGWLSKKALRMRWGYWGFRKYWEKIEDAVERTAGVVAVFEGELIDAVYHSDSGGRTESSQYYWSTAVPYLQSVRDPYEARSPYRRTTERLSYQTAAQELGIEQTAVGGDGSPVVEVLDRSPSGRVLRVRVGSDVLTGREVRERLGLRSNWFDVDVRDGEVLFEVRGYGHGVGMSQYGADGMGRHGSSFQEILKHYFTGIELVQLEQL